MNKLRWLLIVLVSTLGIALGADLAAPQAASSQPNSVFIFV